MLNDFRIGDTLSISGVVFNSTGKAFRLYIVLNDDGTSLPAGQGSGTITECKLDNNVYYFDIIPDPFEVSIEKIVPLIMVNCVLLSPGMVWKYWITVILHFSGMMVPIRPMLYQLPEVRVII